MEKKLETYIYAVGKRKTAVATVRMYAGGKDGITVNDETLAKYFKDEAKKIDVAIEALTLLNLVKDYTITIVTKGGGKASQAEAIRLGISRGLIKISEEYKKTLRSKGFLTRDPRSKERKKPGLKKARRAPQWSKR